MTPDRRPKLTPLALFGGLFQVVLAMSDWQKDDGSTRSWRIAYDRLNCHETFRCADLEDLKGKSPIANESNERCKFCVDLNERN